MKKLITITIILALVACKSETKKGLNDTVQNESEKVSKTENLKKSPEKETKNKTTYLCKINGKDWGYTKASGIVSRHRKTNKREAIFTFTKQLEKGKETVQLFYDGDTNQLEQVNIHLKVPKTDGKRMTAMYLYYPETMKFHPKAKITGSIDLSNSSNASGNAEVKNLNIRYEKNQLKNTGDEIITVTGINFKGIGYSDADKLFGSKDNSANN